MEYLGGNILIPNEYRDSILTLQEKSGVNWSGKFVNVRNIAVSEMTNMVIIPESGELSVLIENVQCTTYNAEGNEVTTGSGVFDWRTENVLPININQALFTEVDGASLSSITTRSGNNISTPYTVLQLTKGGAYIRYIYTYILLHVEFTTRPASGVAFFKSFRNTANVEIDMPELSTVRWGVDDSTTEVVPPLLINNREISVNTSAVVSKSFDDNNYIPIPLTDTDGAKTKIDLLDIPETMLNYNEENYFKLLIVADVNTPVVQIEGTLTLLSTDVILLKSGYYLQTLTLEKGKEGVKRWTVNKDGETVLTNENFYRLRFSTANKAHVLGLCIKLENMLGEYGPEFNDVKTLPTMSDAQPLTNIYLDTTKRAAMTQKINIDYKDWTFISRQKIFPDTFDTFLVFATFARNMNDHVPVWQEKNLSVIRWYVPYVDRLYNAINNKMLQSRSLASGLLVQEEDEVTWVTEFNS